MQVLVVRWGYHVLSLVRLGVRVGVRVGVRGIIGSGVGRCGGCGMWSVILLSEWFRGIVVLRDSGVHGVHLTPPRHKFTGHSDRSFS